VNPQGPLAVDFGCWRCYEIWLETQCSGTLELFEAQLSVPQSKGRRAELEEMYTAFLLTMYENFEGGVEGVGKRPCDYVGDFVEEGIEDEDRLCGGLEGLRLDRGRKRKRKRECSPEWKGFEREIKRRKIGVGGVVERLEKLEIGE